MEKKIIAEKEFDVYSKEELREKALALVNAYFDGKTILMKDPHAGVPDWVSIRHPEYWSYLGEFCKRVTKYKIIEDEKETTSET